MEGIISFLLSIFTFLNLRLFVYRKTTFSNVCEGYNGTAQEYKERFSSREIAWRAYEDALGRYNRIHSKIFFTAQLQGIVLMALAVKFTGASNHQTIYCFVSFLLNIAGIVLTLFSLRIKTGLCVEYSVMGKRENPFLRDKKILFDVKDKLKIEYQSSTNKDVISKEEQEEFDKVIPSIHDRSDFLADMYRVITMYFFISLICATLYFFSSVFIENYFMWIAALFIYCVLFRIFFVQNDFDINEVKEKMERDEIND